jgi:Peptidase family S41
VISKVISIFLFCLVAVVPSFAQNNLTEQKFSVDEMKADISFLKTKLQAVHPALYLYTTKDRINKVFDSLDNGLLAPLTVLEFYHHITVISSVIKDGHTIMLPGEKITQLYNQNSKFLPYKLSVQQDRLYVNKVFTSDSSIQPGDEILQINKISAKEIIARLVERQIRDGYNLTYPVWILDNYFREYYSYHFGHPEHFEIVVKGKSAIAHIDALPKQIFAPAASDGIITKIDDARHWAVLTIKSFDNDILKSSYKQQFETSVSKSFEQINAAGIANLIIDLRNNQGGDIENGVFLLAHLLNKPFAVVQEYYCVDGNGLKACHGPALGLQKPKQKVFGGQVYVLINGGSFSNSAIVASCLRANKRVVFIGEESGGNPNVIAGFIKNIQLPNTKIRVEIPTRQFVITSKDGNDGRGLMPDYLVVPRQTDVLLDKDTVMNYTFELIAKPENAKDSRP